MLNDAHRRNLRVVLGLVEEKMKAIESRLAQPEEHGLMDEIKPDLRPDVEATLRRQVDAAYTLIRRLKDQFALPTETTLASREIFKGLPQIWVMLQESDSRRLQGYGEVDPADAAVLDPLIEQLARLVLDMEAVALGHGDSPTSSMGEERIHS